MGWERFVDVAEWNALTWGNVGVTAALFGSRIVVLGGGLGGVGGEKVRRKGQ